MRAIFWVERRGVEDVTKVWMRPIEVDDLLVELVDLLMNADTESEMVQTRVAFVVRGRVARRDENHY